MIMLIVGSYEIWRSDISGVSEGDGCEGVGGAFNYYYF